MVLMQPIRAGSKAQAAFPELAIRTAHSEGAPLAEAVQRLSPDKWRLAYEFALKRDGARTAALCREMAERVEAQFPKTSPPQLPAPASGATPFSYINPPSTVRARYRRLIETRKPDASAYERQMQLTIRTAVLDGRYTAIGFEIPRRAADPPALVPSDLLKSWTFIDWTNSRIKGNGLLFEAVRLVSTRWLVGEAARELPAKPVLQRVKPEKRRPGRQSREPEIIVAYNELRSHGEIEAGDSYKAVWGKIFALIKKQTGKTNGLGYSTVFPFLKKLH